MICIRVRYKNEVLLFIRCIILFVKYLAEFNLECSNFASQCFLGGTGSYPLVPQG